MTLFLILIIVALLLIIAAQAFGLKDKSKEALFWHKAHGTVFLMYLRAWSKLHSQQQRKKDRLYRNHLKRAYLAQYDSCLVDGRAAASELQNQAFMIGDVRSNHPGQPREKKRTNLKLAKALRLKLSFTLPCALILMLSSCVASKFPPPIKLATIEQDTRTKRAEPISTPDYRKAHGLR